MQKVVSPFAGTDCTLSMKCLTYSLKLCCALASETVTSWAEPASTTNRSWLVVIRQDRLGQGQRREITQPRISMVNGNVAARCSFDG